MDNLEKDHLSEVMQIPKHILLHAFLFCLCAVSPGCHHSHTRPHSHSQNKYLLDVVQNDSSNLIGTWNGLCTGIQWLD